MINFEMIFNMQISTVIFNNLMLNFNKSYLNGKTDELYKSANTLYYLYLKMSVKNGRF